MNENVILNIAGYLFTPLNQLSKLKVFFEQLSFSLKIKGTILLSEEGINLNLSGTIAEVQSFIKECQAIASFENIDFRQSYSKKINFKKLKVKIKKEIISLRQANIQVSKQTANKMAPTQLRQWLDEKKDFLLLDTRNEFEYHFGTFSKAIHLNLKNFQQFPDAYQQLTKDKPIVMFCTGGIRCEKASTFLLQKGYQDIYQLEGGILNYFAKEGSLHYHGECFVFDDRVSVDDSLKETGTLQCHYCQGPVKKIEKQHQCEKC